jgi:uncharacterized membrane protein
MYLLVALALPTPRRSALGKGTSVIQVSVAMRVTQRDDPSSILSVLQGLAAADNTRYNSDLQGLMSDVATELLRRKSSIVAASASSRNFRDREKALREYGFLSVTEGTRPEHESMTKYCRHKHCSVCPDASKPDAGSLSSLATDGGATVAVVTLLLAIDGDMTRPPAIRSLASVEDALRKIAVDSTIDWCLQKADVLWTPSDPSTTLTLRDVTAEFPKLRFV